MAHCSTIIHQILKIFPRHKFETLAKKHHEGQKFRSFNRRSQFIAMTVSQLASRKSLRDLVENIKAKKQKLYHLGMAKTTRSTLAGVNANHPVSGKFA